MSAPSIVRLGTLKDVGHFQEHLRSLDARIPCDTQLLTGAASPFSFPLQRAGINIANRIAVNPMEGWDGNPDGSPSDLTFRRWQRFGQSGAKLIWGGEAVAVSMCARANPNQLVLAPHTRESIGKLRAALIEQHRTTMGSDHGLLIGLQLTHSGRYCRPRFHDKPEPRILYHHPILDRRLKVSVDYPLLTDDEIAQIIDQFHTAARAAWELGFDFVDIKHCHGYLGHEFLSAHTREGKYGGSFENRTRFLREVVEGVRAAAPGLKIGVRLSAIDTIPFRPDPARSSNGKLGPGIPEDYQHLLPYRWGFGVDPQRPTEYDLSEPLRFLALLEELRIPLVNITAGSPYSNAHLQRPALYPPSDGYPPPHDPLLEVARQLHVTHELKQRFPNLIVVGTAYSYLQEFLPYVGQAVLREKWVDIVGLGRAILTYPEILLDATHELTLQRKRICRTFSDCTTAPRNGLPSGCYPLDSHYKHSEMAVRLAAAKAKR
jgi:NADPH2 dehydrogenase